MPRSREGRSYGARLSARPEWRRLIEFALGLFLESFTLALVATPFFALLFVVELKLVEEPELEKRLGEPYRFIWDGDNTYGGRYVTNPSEDPRQDGS